MATTASSDSGQTHKSIQGFTGPGTGVGTFQPSAAASTTVTDANVPASANIVFSAANSGAGVLLYTNTCSIATANAAGSFVFSVSASASGFPSGNETIAYFYSVENL